MQSSSSRPGVAVFWDVHNRCLHPGAWRTKAPENWTTLSTLTHTFQSVTLYIKVLFQINPCGNLNNNNIINLFMSYLLSRDSWGPDKLHIHSNSSPQNFPAGLFDSNPKVTCWSAFVGQCSMFKQNHFSLWSYARVGEKTYFFSTVFPARVITFKDLSEI